MNPRAVSAAASVAILLVSACASTTEPLLPDARELTETAVLRGGYDLAAVDDGFVAVWTEISAGDGSSDLYFTHVDFEGRAIASPKKVAIIEARQWLRLQLVVTPTGYNVWHSQAYRDVGTVILDEGGDYLTTIETSAEVGSTSGPMRAASIGDSVLVVWREWTGEIRFRIYNDQGVPRTDEASLRSGGDPEVLVRADSFDVFWLESGAVWGASILPTGEVVSPPTMIAADADLNPWSIAVAPVGDDGAFVGWLRDVGPGEGAAFSYLRADAAGWAEPRALFAPNRHESLDLCLSADGDRVLVGWQSDAEHAVPQMRLGSIDPAAGEVTIDEADPLTPVGLRANGCRLSEGTMGAAALLSVDAEGQTRLFFSRVGGAP